MEMVARYAMVVADALDTRASYANDRQTIRRAMCILLLCILIMFILSGIVCENGKTQSNRLRKIIVTFAAYSNAQSKSFYALLILFCGVCVCVCRFSFTAEWRRHFSCVYEQLQNVNTVAMSSLVCVHIKT